MMTKLGNIGVLVLAAGSSSRLGSAKQLLSFQHKSLLDITIDAAKGAATGRIIVILGGNHQLIESAVKQPEVRLMFNPDWEEGISSSIRLGITAFLEEENNPDAVILTVCDQPYISSGLLKTLIEKAEVEGKSIVSSAYEETFGVPVLFHQQYFRELAGLKGKEGAKTLLRKYREEVSTVPFEDGGIDIDTPEDYMRLLTRNK